jgi:hypothetical protein
MTPLRQTIEADLSDTLEGEFASLAALTDPNGALWPNIPCRIDYDAQKEEMSAGGAIIVKVLTVVMRISTLMNIVGRVPQASENWAIAIPPRPDQSTLATYKLGGTRAPEVQASIGFVRFYPENAGQS